MKLTGKSLFISMLQDPEIVRGAVQRSQARYADPEQRRIGFVWYLLWLCGMDTQMFPTTGAYLQGLERLGFLLTPALPQAGDLLLEEDRLYVVTHDAGGLSYTHGDIPPGEHLYPGLPAGGRAVWRYFTPAERAALQETQEMRVDAPSQPLPQLPPGEVKWTPDQPARGLGDLVAKAAEVTGVARVAKAVEKVTGKPCGCKKRQEALNQAFPAKG